MRCTQTHIRITHHFIQTVNAYSGLFPFLFAAFAAMGFKYYSPLHPPWAYTFSSGPAHPPTQRVGTNVAGMDRTTVCAPCAQHSNQVAVTTHVAPHCTQYTAPAGHRQQRAMTLYDWKRHKRLVSYGHKYLCRRAGRGSW